MLIHSYIISHFFDRRYFVRYCLKELRAIGYYLNYGAPTDDEPKYWIIDIPEAYALDTIPKEMW